MLFQKIALIGDVHAEDEALAGVLAWLQSQNCDLKVCVGDITDGEGDAARCIELLRENEVLTVRGNHDSWFLGDYGRNMENATSNDEISFSQRKWLQVLPATRAIETVLGPLLLCHGVGENEMAQLRAETGGYALEYLLELQEILAQNKFRLMVGGHTHQKMVRKIGALTAINPGTLKRTHPQTFAVLDGAAKCVRFYNWKVQNVDLAQQIEI